MQKVLTSKIPSGYEFFISYKNDIPDNFGRLWRMKVSAIKGGGVFFFDRLSEMEKWTREVEYKRQMENGEKTVLERWVEAFHCGELNEEVFWLTYNRISHISKFPET